jgi:hypothetical protein
VEALQDLRLIVDEQNALQARIRVHAQRPSAGPNRS